MPSRRQFLSRSALGLAGLAVGGRAAVAADKKPADMATAVDATAPPAFGTAPPVGPVGHAGHLRRGGEAGAGRRCRQRSARRRRRIGACRWRRCSSGALGPRKLALGDDDVPATVWNPAAAVGAKVPAPGKGERFVRSRGAAPPLPARDEDIAFAPLTSLSRWIESKKLTSERLTSIYLDAARALSAEAPVQHHHRARTRRWRRRSAPTREIARGKYRGPLHGIPWGAKDLVDTAGLLTTWGAEPFRTRVPTTDATVVKRLADAGAVLVAKLSLGALALNDVWFGGQTKNPWNLDEGSSGSSAGPGVGDGGGPGRLRARLGDARQHRLAVDALRSQPGCVRPSGACRAPAPWRCAGRSTSWGRWRAAWRTRCSCCARCRGPTPPIRRRWRRGSTSTATRRCAGCASAGSRRG